MRKRLQNWVKLDRQPDFLPSRFLLAGCFWNLGQQEKSLAEFEKIKRLIPSSLPEAWKQLPYRDQMHADRFSEALWGLGLKIWAELPVARTSFLLAMLTKRGQGIQRLSLVSQERPWLGDAEIVPRKNQTEMTRRGELLCKAGYSARALYLWFSSKKTPQKGSF